MAPKLRNLFSSHKRTSSKDTAGSSSRYSKSGPVSPTASIYSVSTASTSSNGPQTPGLHSTVGFGMVMTAPTTPVKSQHAYHPPAPSEMRGLIRTLRAQWRVYDAQAREWVCLDDHTSFVLEDQYQQHAPNVVLSRCGPFSEPCVVHLGGGYYMKPLPGRPGQPQQHQGRKLHLGRDVDRAEVPVWWYEDDINGTKSMTALSHKNQVRLEALAGDDERSIVALNEDAFQDAGSVMAMLNPSSGVHLREEIRGFLYIYPRAQQHHPMPQNKPLPHHEPVSLERRCSV
ncbi:hypothetical protein BC940DRAFT_315763 [Gongronella butleri]|nr:hypothetical protein BC940DRAFT_315763 [Gongronella butleri]